MSGQYTFTANGVRNCKSVRPTGSFTKTKQNHKQRCGSAINSSCQFLRATPSPKLKSRQEKEVKIIHGVKTPSNSKQHTESGQKRGLNGDLKQSHQGYYAFNQLTQREAENVCSCHLEVTSQELSEVFLVPMQTHTKRQIETMKRKLESTSLNETAVANNFDMSRIIENEKKLIAVLKCLQESQHTNDDSGVFHLCVYYTQSNNRVCIFNAVHKEDPIIDQCSQTDPSIHNQAENDRYTNISVLKVKRLTNGKAKLNTTILKDTEMVGRIERHIKTSVAQNKKYASKAEMQVNELSKQQLKDRPSHIAKLEKEKTLLEEQLQHELKEQTELSHTLQKQIKAINEDKEMICKELSREKGDNKLLKENFKQHSASLHQSLDENRELRKALSCARKENEKLTESLEQNKSHLQMIKQESFEWQQAFERKETELSRVKDELQKQFIERTQHLTKQNLTQILDKRIKMGQVNESLQQTIREKESLPKTLNTLKEKNEDMTEKMSEWKEVLTEQESFEWQQANIRKENKLSLLKDELEKQVIRLTEHFAKQNKEAHASNAHLTQILDEQRVNLGQVNESLQQTIREKESLQQTFNTLKEKNKIMSEKKSEWEGVLKRYKSENEDLKLQLSELKAEVKCLEESLAAANETTEEKIVSNSRELTNHLRQLQAEKQREQENFMRLEEISMTNFKNATEDLDKKLNILQGKNERLSSENQSLILRLNEEKVASKTVKNESNAACSQLRLDIERQSEELSVLKRNESKLHQSLDKNRELRKALNSARIETEKLTESLEQNKSLLQKTEQESFEWQQASLRKENELSLLKDELEKQVTKRTEHFTKQNEETLARNAHLTQILDEQQAKMEQINESLQQTRRENENLQQTLKTFKKENKDRTEKIAEREEVLKRYKSENEDVKLQLSELKAEVKSLEESLAAAKETTEEKLVSNSRELTHQLRQLQAEKQREQENFMRLEETSRINFNNTAEALDKKLKILQGKNERLSSENESLILRLNEEKTASQSVKNESNVACSQMRLGIERQKEELSVLKRNESKLHQSLDENRELRKALNSARMETKKVTESLEQNKSLLQKTEQESFEWQQASLRKENELSLLKDELEKQVIKRTEHFTKQNEETLARNAHLTQILDEQQAKMEQINESLQQTRRENENLQQTLKTFKKENKDRTEKIAEREEVLKRYKSENEDVKLQLSELKAEVKSLEESLAAAKETTEEKLVSNSRELTNQLRQLQAEKQREQENFMRLEETSRTNLKNATEDLDKKLKILQGKNERLSSENESLILRLNEEKIASQTVKNESNVACSQMRLEVERQSEELSVLKRNESKLHQSLDENRELRKALNSARIETEKLTESLEQNKSLLQKTEHESFEWQQASLRKENELSLLKDELEKQVTKRTEHFTKQNEETLARNAHLTQILDEQQAKMEQINESLQRTRRENENLQQTLKTFKKENKDKTEKIAEREEVLKRYKSENEDVKLQLSKLKAEVKSLEESLAAAKETTEEKIVSNSRELTNQLRQLQAEKQREQENFMRLEETSRINFNNTAEALDKKLKILQGKNERLSCENESLILRLNEEKIASQSVRNESNVACSQMRLEIERQSEELSVLKRNESKLQQSLDENRELRKALNSARIETKKLTESLEQNKSLLQKTEHESFEWQQASLRKENELSLLKDELEKQVIKRTKHFTKQNEETLARNAHLTQILDEQQAKMEQINESLQQTRRENENLQQTLKTFKKENKDRTEKTAEREEVLKRYKSENEDLKLQLSEHKAEVKSLEESLAAAKETTEEKLVSNSRELTNHLRQLQAEKQREQENFMRLEEPSRTNLKNATEDLDKKLKILQGKNERLSSENQSLILRLNEEKIASQTVKNESNVACSQMRLEVERQSEELSVLKRNESKLHQSLDENRELRKALKSARIETEKLTESLEQNKSLLQKTEHESFEWQQASLRKENELSLLKDELEIQVIKRTEHFTKQNEETHARNAHLTQILDEQQARMEQINESLQQTRRENENLQQTLKTFKKENKDKTEKIAEREEVLKRYKSENEDVKLQLSELKAEVKSIEESLATAKETTEEKLVSNSRELTNQLRQLQAEKQREQENFMRLEETARTNLKNATEALDKKLKILQGKNERLSSENQSLILRLNEEKIASETVKNESNVACSQMRLEVERQSEELSVLKRNESKPHQSLDENRELRKALNSARIETEKLTESLEQNKSLLQKTEHESFEWQQASLRKENELSLLKDELEKQVIKRTEHFTKQNEETHARNAHLTQILDEQQAKMEQINESLQQTRRENENLQQTLKTFKKENKDGTDKIAEREEVLKRYKSENEDLKLQLSELKTEVKCLEESLAAAKETTEEKLVSNSRELTNQLHHLQAEKQREQENFMRLEETSRTNFKNATEALDKKLKILQGKNERLSSENESLILRLNEEKIASETVQNESNVACSQLRLEIERQSEELSVLKRNESKLHQSLDENRELRKALNSARIEAKQLIVSLEQNKSLLQKTEHESFEWQQASLQKENELSLLKDELEKQVLKKTEQYKFISKLEKENVILRKELVLVRQRMQEINADVDRFTAENSSLQHTLQHKIAENMKVLEKLSSAELQLNLATSTISDLRKSVTMLQTEIAGLEAANQKVLFSAQRQKNEEPINRSKPLGVSDNDLQQQLRQTKEQLNNLQKELDDTRTRLSRAMGDRLTDNNPNITDLSDKNRPTKISERYQELYDNQWTDAFEVVDETYGNEESSIVLLKDILMATVTFCKEEAERQMKQLVCTLSKGQDIPAHLLKQLKDARKSTAETYGKQMLEEYKMKINESRSDRDNMACKVLDFVDECFQVSWLMAVQDPPVVLGPDIATGETFNKDHYKAYTKGGTTIKYIVWPVLLLHQGGPVLCKGVAQG